MTIGQIGSDKPEIGRGALPGYRPSVAAAMAAEPRVLLIVPCFNEEEMVGDVLEEIDNLALDYDTVVVDDGSSDATYDVARPITKAVRLPHNLGIGGAVQTGIKYAERAGYDFCVQIDGDGQHPPEGVAALLKAYRETPSDIIVGSRYLLNNTFRSTWSRRLGSQLIAATLGWLFHTEPVTDPTSGMRLMNRKAIEFFARRYPQDFPEPISLAWALREGLTVSETPVEMRPRYTGRSSIYGLKPIAYMLRVLGYIALARVARIR